MKHYVPLSEPGTKYIYLLLLFLLLPSIHIAVAQQLLFPDEFKRPPGSDPGAPVTANAMTCLAHRFMFCGMFICRQGATASGTMQISYPKECTYTGWRQWGYSQPGK